jgi:hypothetical protein
MLKTMAEFKQAHKKNGGHFFDPSAMRFFNSKIESGLLGQEDKQVFITSERPSLTDPKKYTIRHAHKSGSVTDVSDFGQFDTLEEALFTAGIAQNVGGWWLNR